MLCRGSEASSVNDGAGDVGASADAPTSVSAAGGVEEPGLSSQSPPLPKAVAGGRWFRVL